MPDIIVEVCQNHNGDPKIIRTMLAKAAEAGATWAKLQCIYSEDLARRDRFEEGKVQDGKRLVIKRPFGVEFERLRCLDLPLEAYAQAVSWCKEFGLKSMVTVFSRNRVTEMAKLDWDAVKVASYDCASTPLIKELAESFRYIIISTGATFAEEVENTASMLDREKFALLHCTTIYPTPAAATNLKRMDWLKKFSSKVGFSDHSPVKLLGVNASMVALWRGAEFIERHFTILDEDKTKDGPVSIKPEHVKQLVEFATWDKEKQLSYLRKSVPDYEVYIGTGGLDLTSEELLNRDYYRGRFASHVKGQPKYNWED